MEYGYRRNMRYMSKIICLESSNVEEEIGLLENSTRALIPSNER